MLWDFHTHIKRDNTQKECSIYNLNVPEHLCRCGLDLQNTFYSLGIHPWKIYLELLSEHLRFIEENIHFSVVKAVGECGLDKLTPTPWDLQLRAFQAQIEISEKYQKPLIIHVVKAIDELLAIRKEFQPSQAWVIHGFRGKPEQMEQLLSHGLYFSFGIKYNEETLLRTPLDRFFLETDETTTSIRELYRSVAKLLRIDELGLINQIEDNINTILSF